jgi:hypothetical protein
VSPHLSSLTFFSLALIVSSSPAPSLLFLFPPSSILSLFPPSSTLTFLSLYSPHLLPYLPPLLFSLLSLSLSHTHTYVPHTHTHAHTQEPKKGHQAGGSGAGPGDGESTKRCQHTPSDTGIYSDHALPMLWAVLSLPTTLLLQCIHILHGPWLPWCLVYIAVFPSMARMTCLCVQTALTEVKTKLKLEQRLGDKEKELTAVKHKLQEVSSRARKCNRGVCVLHMYVLCTMQYCSVLD